MAKQKTIQVEDNIDLVRDVASGAIINTNKNAIVKRRERIAKDKAKEAEFEQMKSEIEELKKIVKKLSK